MNTVTRTERQYLGAKKPKENSICHSFVKLFIAIGLMFAFKSFQSLGVAAALVTILWFHP